tara:strand:+ start:449 stop:721 length:273 start_codon:yes stop_codon:yes gene_type:complete
MASKACEAQIEALAACKKVLGLYPKQCYPAKGYKGECDRSEFDLKACHAHAVDPQSAKVLYDTSRPRAERVAANQRLQYKLKPYEKPCTP